MTLGNQIKATIISAKLYTYRHALVSKNYGCRLYTHIRTHTRATQKSRVYAQDFSGILGIKSKKKKETISYVI